MLFSHPSDEKKSLGLKNDLLWNKAAVGKLVWWIHAKPDHLWVKWINHIYLKGKTWQNYSPPNDSSWYWRKICQVKFLLADAYNHDEWVDQKGREYTIKKGYEFLRTKGDKIEWMNLVWTNWSIPKHSMLSWFYHHNSLNTKEKLHKLGISENDTCIICENGTENNEHLFFQCEYSTAMLDIISSWVRVHLPSRDLLTWRLNMQGSSLQQDVINAIINATMYHVWRQRNLSKFELKLLTRKAVARDIVEEIKSRMRGMKLTKAGDGDRRWLELLTDRK
ncbi:uncharacterized protein LOC141589607 [Silene latifolia]|uniref:uncharacterized protein LOC141589607 n=1 Tax=Silene latifolia TaxID=37657 RepID=UPI003D78B1B4